MKKQKSFLKLRKNKIANLRLTEIIGADGRPTTDPDICGTNTNTNSNFCPPKSAYTCKKAGCPPVLTTN